jgi:predicted metal-dependent hydrolase
VLSFLRRKPTLPPPSLTIGAREVPLTVRQSGRARRVALRIDAAGAAVELVLPTRVPLSVGLDFLDSRKGWVAARLALMPEHVAFADGAEVPVFGVPHRIRHLGTTRQAGNRIVSIEEGEIRVVGDPAHVARRVRDHLVGLARAELTRRARALAMRIDRRVARVSVRDTKSRWGSCSTAGNLAFSWRLVLAPEAVLDYVVAHEVAHLAEMNHSKRFWRLVEALAPGAARLRAWLKTHRTRLLRYG